jgi:hypothetical protein
MSTLFITEFAEVHLGLGGRQGQITVQPPVAEQTVSIGVLSAASNAFNSNTQAVRLHADVICSIEFGLTPTATATTARFVAGQTEYFGVPRGMGYKVAVIANT